MPRSRPPAVWFAAEPPRRPRLSRERIVTAAVALLDAEGVAGFSMRRLAARLDAGAMSLYEYVGGREDVLDLAVDEAIGEIATPADAAAGGPWREVLAAHLARTREVMRRHRWLPQLAASRPLVGPRALARAEVCYAALARAGLRGPRLVAAVGTLTAYVQGFVAMENAWADWARDPAAAAELRREVQRFLDERADRHPALARHAQVELDDFDAMFRMGLDLVLDGVEARPDATGAA